MSALLVVVDKCPTAPRRTHVVARQGRGSRDDEIAAERLGQHARIYNLLVVMLPDFPASKTEIRKHIMRATEQAERAKAPLLAKIKSFAQHEGTAHSYDRIGAKAVTDEGFEAIAIPVTIDVSEIPDLVGEKLAAKIDAVADGLARKRMEMFYRKMNEGTEEGGNAMDMKGAPLTQDAFFTMLERVDMEFGPDNLPTSVWHTTPALAEVIGKWDDDPAFRSRYEELLDRKRNEWRDRESNRKLVE